MTIPLKTENHGEKTEITFFSGLNDNDTTLGAINVKKPKDLSLEGSTKLQRGLCAASVTSTIAQYAIPHSKSNNNYVGTLVWFQK